MNADLIFTVIDKSSMFQVCCVNVVPYRKGALRLFYTLCSVNSLSGSEGNFLNSKNNPDDVIRAWAGQIFNRKPVLQNWGVWSMKDTREYLKEMMS